MLVGAEARGRWVAGAGRLMRALLLSPFVSQKLSPLASKERKEDLLAVKELIEAGTVTPVIDRTYQLVEAADAIRHLDRGHGRGKVVITVRGSERQGAVIRRSNLGAKQTTGGTT